MDDRPAGFLVERHRETARRQGAALRLTTCLASAYADAGEREMNPCRGDHSTPLGHPRCAAEPTSTGEELQGLCGELVVKLEDAAVPSVGIDLDLAVRQAFGQVERVGRRHHAVVIAVCDKDWLPDGGQVGRLLHAPGVNGLELGAEGSDRDRLVTNLGSLLQPRDELLRL